MSNNSHCIKVNTTPEVEGPVTDKSGYRFLLTIRNLGQTLSMYSFNTSNEITSGADALQEAGLPNLLDDFPTDSVLGLKITRRLEAGI